MISTPKKSYSLNKRETATPPEHTSLKRQLLNLLAAVFFAALVYISSQLVTFYFFEVQVWSGTWKKDLIAHLVLAGVLYSVAGRWLLWLLSYTLLVFVLQISNALKLNILGSPVMPDDFFAVYNMLHLFDDWRLPAIFLSIFIPMLSLTFMIAWKRKRSWIAFSLALCSSIIIWQQASVLTKYMDDTYGDWIWNQPGNYRDRGLILHLVHEGLRNISRSQVTISEQEAIAAREHFQPKPQELANNASPGGTRNIYIILLESFWDPMLLTSAGISPDPVSPRFRELWRQTGHSTTSAPVFGGYTANSEFEVLCGFPVVENAVFFEGWLRNDVPCLPHYLSGAGYKSVAAHPNEAAFWNRVNSYNRIGFDEYWSKNDFQLDDMNREFLSDKSLYRQVWQKLEKNRENPQPLLMYIVTFFGHLDYPLSKSRPKVITTVSKNSMLEGYVNQIHYKSNELMDFVELLQKEDPQALIVMFGDHLPFLGAHHDGFVQEGLFPRNKGEFDAQMFKAYVTTPLIIIDGKKGPVSVGSLPMYHLPARILSLLGDEHDSPLHLAAHPDLAAIRPLAGLTLHLPVDAPPLLCRQGLVNEDQRCNELLDTTAKFTTLRDDIFTGMQFSMQPLETINKPAPPDGGKTAAYTQ